MTVFADDLTQKIPGAADIRLGKIESLPVLQHRFRIGKKMKGPIYKIRMARIGDHELILRRGSSTEDDIADLFRYFFHSFTGQSRDFQKSTVCLYSFFFHYFFDFPVTDPDAQIRFIKTKITLFDASCDMIASSSAEIVSEPSATKMTISAERMESLLL